MTGWAWAGQLAAITAGLPCGYIPDLRCLGVGRVGPAGARYAWGASLDSELLGWEEVFFPVEATFGNWAGTSSISFSKCCLLMLAWHGPVTRWGNAQRGICLWVAREPLPNVSEEWG